MPKEQLIRLYEDSAQPGHCRGCEAPIVWYETLRGKKMPMNQRSVPVKSEKEADTGRVIAFFSASDSHFSTCPDAAKFSRKAR